MRINYHILDNDGFYEIDENFLKNLNLTIRNHKSFTDKGSAFLDHNSDGDNLLDTLRDKGINFRLIPLYNEKSPLCQLATY